MHVICGHDVIGVAWQNSALPVRVQVPLLADYPLEISLVCIVYTMRVIGGLLIVALGIALVAFSANLAKTF